MKRSPLLATLAAVSLAATLAACSDSTSSGSSGTNADGSKKYSIGFVLLTSNDPVSVRAQKGLTDVAKSKGWSVSVVDPRTAAAQALSGMENLVQKKVDLIVTVAFPATTLTAGIQAAKAAGIPVATVGGGLADGVQNAWDFALAQGQMVADRMKQDIGSTPTNVLALGYSPGRPCQQREQAFNETIKPLPNVKLTRNEVDGTNRDQSSQNFTSAWLATLPKDANAAIWTCTDNFAVPAASVVSSSGRKVTIYAMDGNPAGLQAIKRGQIKLDLWTNAEAAGQDIANNVPQIVAAGVKAEGITHPVPSVLVTADTLDQFLKEHPDADQS